MLSTNGSFDYEIVKEYVLNIEAKDKGEPPLSDMCMVTVYITDANDNKPTFSQTIYTANVGEDAEIGDHVIQVFCTLHTLQNHVSLECLISMLLLPSYTDRFFTYL